MPCHPEVVPLEELLRPQPFFPFAHFGDIARRPHRIGPHARPGVAHVHDALDPEIPRESFPTAYVRRDVVCGDGRHLLRHMTGLGKVHGNRGRLDRGQGYRDAHRIDVRELLVPVTFVHRYEALGVGESGRFSHRPHARQGRNDEGKTGFEYFSIRQLYG